MVALLHVRGLVQLDSTGDNNLGLHNNIANAADKRVVVDAVFRSAFRTDVRLKMNSNKRSDLSASSNLDYIPRSQRCIVILRDEYIHQLFLDFTTQTQSYFAVWTDHKELFHGENAKWRRGR